MKNLLFVSIILIVVLSLAGCSESVKVDVTPNIIIIFNDDQGYQDLGCYGSPLIKTPHVDQLALEGMRFTNFYVASSVCSASRASLLSGCYPQKVGVNGVFWPNIDDGFDPEHVTIAEVLKSKGYNTAAIGKWHLGDQDKYLPTNQGFDSYYGIPYSNDMYPSKTMRYADSCLFLEGITIDTINEAFKGDTSWSGQPKSMYCKVPLMRNNECIEFPCDQTTITRRLTDESIHFITESAKNKKPFFLYLANPMPHYPLFASNDFSGTSARGLYGDVIEEIDFNTGRILDQLTELGIDENTIVIFTSDNGPWLSLGYDNAGSADPLFEGKFTCFEGGLRVPCIIKWPAKIPAGSTCSELASTIDILPTLANAVGAKLPEKKLDGSDIIDLWTAKQGATTPHEYYFYVRGSAAAVRSGDWKYHKKEEFMVAETKREFNGPTLYNLKEDLGESKNVINQYPEVAKKLASALEEHLQRISN